MIVSAAAVLIASLPVGRDEIDRFFSVEAAPALPRVQFRLESSAKVEIKGADKPGTYSFGLGLTLPRKSPLKAIAQFDKLKLEPMGGGWSKPLNALRISGCTIQGPRGAGASFSLFAKPAAQESFSVFRWHEASQPPQSAAGIREFANGYLETLAHFDEKKAKSSAPFFLRSVALQTAQDGLVLVVAPDSHLPKEGAKPAVSLAAQTDRGPVTLRRSPRPLSAPPFQSNESFFARLGGESRLSAFFESSRDGLRIAYASKDGEFLVEHQSLDGQIKAFPMPVFHGLVSSLIRSQQGDYYYFTFSREVEPIATLVRTDSEGRLLARVNLDPSESSFDLRGLAGSTSSLAVNDRSVFLISSRGMHSGHQGAFAAAFDAKTLALRKYYGQTASHSFANRAFSDHGVFVSLDLADNFPRGIRITKFSESDKVARTIFTYKTRHQAGTRAGLDDGKPRTPGQWSNDNNTYSQLGSFLSTPNGFLAAFAAEQSADNSKAVQNYNESRNVGIALVRKDFQNISQAETIVPPKLLFTQGPASPLFGFYDYVGRYERQQFRDISWLTQYSDREKESAANPRVAELGDSQYVVLWEEWEVKGFKGVKAVVIDEFGNVQSQVMSLGSKIRISGESWPKWVGSYLVWSYQTRDSIHTVAWKAAKF